MTSWDLRRIQEASASVEEGMITRVVRISAFVSHSFLCVLLGALVVSGRFSLSSLCYSTARSILHRPAEPPRVSSQRSRTNILPTISRFYPRLSRSSGLSSRYPTAPTASRLTDF